MVFKVVQVREGRESVPVGITAVSILFFKHDRNSPLRAIMNCCFDDLELSEIMGGNYDFRIKANNEFNCTKPDIPWLTGTRGQPPTSFFLRCARKAGLTRGDPKTLWLVACVISCLHCRYCILCSWYARLEFYGNVIFLTDSKLVLHCLWKSRKLLKAYHCTSYFTTVVNRTCYISYKSRRNSHGSIHMNVVSTLYIHL